MKKFATILLLAISSFALSSEFTPASATKMNGKCCQSSDGGRPIDTSWRYAGRQCPIPATPMRRRVCIIPARDTDTGYVSGRSRHGAP